jgi:tRNA pseudouridine38-40 synthase
MRFFFEVSYKGTNYHGWQSQKNAVSVQEIIEKVLSIILQEDIKIIASGRTDAGVHCRQQFFHADIERSFDRSWLLQRINSFLPDDIAILMIKQVLPETHARFDACSRSYSYVISRIKDPFSTEFSYFYRNPVNISTMNEAASLLLGRQNFQSFSKVHTDVSNFVCEITEAEWHEDRHQLIFNISANRFLRGMVRTIVGTLLEVGKEKMDTGTFKKIIEAKNRKKAGAAAPPQGLFLTKVQYPEHIFKTTD